MVLTNIKTPGVYIDEISLFPPSIAQVETAIPAFIGYTAKAVDAEGQPITDPFRIRSLVEFRTFFGEGYQPETYTVKIDVGKKEIQTSTPSMRFYLYDAVRQFYDNGGGDCYIVSVAFFSMPDGTPRPISVDGLSGGIDKLKKFDEPTLILFPDAVGLLGADGKPDYAGIATLQTKALSQCADLQDRFTIMDVMEGFREKDGADRTVDKFRANVGTNNLKYGAAYYPWLVTNYDILINMQQLALKDLADADIDPESFNRTASDIALYSTYKERSLIIQSLGSQITFNPDDAAEDTADRNQFEIDGASVLILKLQTLELLVDGSSNAAAAKENFGRWLDFLSGLVTAFPKLEALPDFAAGPNRLAIEAYKQNQAFTNAVRLLIALEKQPRFVADAPDARDPETVYAGVTPDWTGSVDFATIDLNAIDPAYDQTAYTPAGKNSTMAILGDLNEKVVPSIIAAYENAFYLLDVSENALFSGHSLFKGVADKIKETMRTIPPSGAIAGVYAATDRTRGVWKAPANVSLSGVLGPAIKIDNNDQDDLNVPTSGKAINAIRAFTNKGTLVWGARTLAGNDNEWRYVSVRRFFIMVEESVKKATEPFVFEPNDANTWIKIKVMIENFLTLQWRAGAMQGAKADDAFFVHVGLGETMTDIDLLEGRMIVEIGMAVVRPAEFIILRFSHKMMEQ